MSNGSIGIGNGLPSRKIDKPVAEQVEGSGSSLVGPSQQMQAGQAQDCGAMSQQGSFSYHGNVSSPQQLVHLVGCRDPKVRSAPWTRKTPQQC